MVDKHEVGRVPDGTGLSSPTEPQERLGPAGFDPSRDGLLVWLQDEIDNAVMPRERRERYARIAEILRADESLMAQGSERIEELRQTRDRLCETLEECREYFDGRADAECFPDSPSYVGNEEMKLLVMVDEALRRAK